MILLTQAYRIVDFGWKSVSSVLCVKSPPSIFKFNRFERTDVCLHGNQNYTVFFCCVSHKSRPSRVFRFYRITSDDMHQNVSRAQPYSGVEPDAARVRPGEPSSSSTPRKLETFASVNGPHKLSASHSTMVQSSQKSSPRTWSLSTVPSRKDNAHFQDV